MKLINIPDDTLIKALAENLQTSESNISIIKKLPSKDIIRMKISMLWNTADEDGKEIQERIIDTFEISENGFTQLNDGYWESEFRDELWQMFLARIGFYDEKHFSFLKQEIE